MTKKPFLQIALACFVTAVVSSMSIFRISLRYFVFYVHPPILGGIVLIYFLAMLVYIAVGIRRMIRTRHNEASQLAFWQGALRYFIALDLCVFGVGKFFHIQFNIPLAILDDPYNTLSRDQLMWAFFGYATAFPVIIGIMQIIGSMMLLFRKTRLVAVIFLIPILLNIFLLDFFYNDLGTTLYSGIEIVALIYLLLIEYDRLFKFFFVDESGLPKLHFKSNIWKGALRCSIIVIPLLLMAINRFPQYYPEINGKYEVKNVIINNIPQGHAPCVDSVLTRVYIDKNDFVMDYNSYKRRFIGSYQYNAATGQITATWRYPATQHDTLFGKILAGKTPNMKVLTGRMGKEEFRIDMLRVNN
ncbi:MAG TPA: hypothetical protein VGN20_21825 [Mucilaginibacter sp.]|jgi:hypothetical protein